MTQRLLEELSKAIEARDVDAFARAMLQAFRTYKGGFPAELGATLAEALLMPWHRQHEDIARELQIMRWPGAVAALRVAALHQHAYLSYDGFFGLARKCTWALADIGTAEAKSALEELARNENSLIAGYAQKRLDSWDEELSRKGVRS